MELSNFPIGLGARRAIPLRDLEPGSVGTWPPVSSTQREDLEYLNIELKSDLIKSSFLNQINYEIKHDLVKI